MIVLLAIRKKNYNPTQIFTNSMNPLSYISDVYIPVNHTIFNTRKTNGKKTRSCDLCIAF